MSSNQNQQNQKPQEAPKEGQPKEGQPKEVEKKAESSGSKPEYKGNNPGGSGWKDKKKA